VRLDAFEQIEVLFEPMDVRDGACDLLLHYVRSSSRSRLKHYMTLCGKAYAVAVVCATLLALIPLDESIAPT
jgi:hypothetical protein